MRASRTLLPDARRRWPPLCLGCGRTRRDDDRAGAAPRPACPLRST